MYEELKAQRGDDAKLEACIKAVVKKLTNEHTDENHPGMLLGKIQSGKTRAFLGVIALAFDNGFDIAIVLTKGTKTLAKQTVKRISSDFKNFRSDDRLDVFDIMELPTLTPWELDEKKLVFVAKKETNNMKRLLKLFHDTHPELANKRVLIVDDEADFASIRFTKTKAGDIEQGRIAEQIDDLRRELSNVSFLQVTATPYALYLQPDEYAATPGSNFTFEPKRPAFTELVPIHDAYIGGHHYFGDHEPNEPEFYLWHPVDTAELTALKKEDRRRVKTDEVLTSSKIEAIRHALMTFVVAGSIRRLQQQSANASLKKYAMVVHVETSRNSHAWQYTVVGELLDAIKTGIANSDLRINELFQEAYDDLSRSVVAAKQHLPSQDETRTMAFSSFSKGAVMAEKVNSDNDIMALLDDNAELKLRTPFNIFIGGQILDRGITIPNLIGFYYGRSPNRMQQDTVLQHSRMYGARPAADMAVTRFYTTAHNHSALKNIHEFDTALREAFESNAHARGVAFIQRDTQNRVIPCAPSKVLVSDQVTIRPGRSLIPLGFQSHPKTHIARVVTEIEFLVPESAVGTDRPQKISLNTASKIIEMISGTMTFDPGYSFDWNAMIATIEYFSRIAAPKKDQDQVWVMAEKGRRLSRFRAGGRVSNAPDTKQQARVISQVATNLPLLLLVGQTGEKELGWGGSPFWWPVLFAPADAVPCVFASSNA